MHFIRIAGATLNQTPLDWDNNCERILRAIREARQLGVDLLVFPELSATGYGCEDEFLSLGTARDAEALLGAVLDESDGITVAVGLPVFHHGALYNCVVLIQNRVILGCNAKKNLAREGVHYEPRWFQPWPIGVSETAVLCDQTVPFGDIIYDLGGIRIAVEICEEAWTPVPAAARAGHVDVVINTSASHFSLGKYQKRCQLVANSSRSLNAYYLYTNFVGLEAGRIVYDGGVLLGYDGAIVGAGRRFGFSPEELVVRDIDLELVRVNKLKNRSYGDLPTRESAVASPQVITGPGFRARTAADVQYGCGQFSVPAAMEPNEEFLRAIALALFDYLRKTGARSYVISLSGGCDSAVVAVLVAQMFALALADLGSEAVARILNTPNFGSDPRSWTAKMLTCVYQKTSNSGAVTENAARQVAEALGAEFLCLDVQPAVSVYTQAAEAGLRRSLSWEKDDLALQNIQARARSPLAWLIANLRGGILLATSNRSEAAVGYATMDGDTSGGLSPIAGIDKPFLRQWLRWMETDCLIGTGPISALSAVNVQAPTAELRPRDQVQTDEGDLMPYEILTAIETRYVRDKLSPDEILSSLVLAYPNLDPKLLAGHVAKFLDLWRKNQWKRERLAPGIHVDSFNVEPRSWCRYPILSAPWRPKGEG